ncbi:MbtH family NRPS accessory protein [Streptomyces sp. MS06]|uniref:MbtH family NRPS accessory protein n=1 Tax=Streptomyces sp. MS06 TaxID=3385974 RepID=UPI0039A0A278
MTGPPSPFDPPSSDPPAEEQDRRLVLRADGGELSLWPAWRAVPPGWQPVFGPAPHADCLARIGADRR